MGAHAPPVPPANRSTKGPGENAGPKKSGKKPSETVIENVDERGETGNIHQNTTNPGYQQDR